MITTAPADILLVEDNPDDADLTMRALRKGGLANTVEWVTDGAQAIEYLFREGRYADAHHSNPKIVLLDLKLPLVSGIEVLGRVKSDDRTKTIPVVVLTSSNEDKDRVESYGLGTNGYVVKPVDFGDFYNAVHTLGMYWLLINTPPLDSQEII